MDEGASHKDMLKNLRRRWVLISTLVVALLAAIVGAAIAVSSAYAAGSSGTPTPTVTSTNGAGPHGHGPWGGGPRNHGPGRLKVVSVSGSQIVAEGPNSQKVTIKVSSSTTYVRAGQKVSASAVVVGDTIGVMGTRNSDGTITASQVMVALPGYHGTITAISGDTITVKDARTGTTHKIEVNSSTKYASGPRSSSTLSLSTLKVGDNIHAEGTLSSNGTLTASLVTLAPARPAGPHADGPGCSGVKGSSSAKSTATPTTKSTTTSNS